MFITINGQLASGKSAVCDLLIKNYGYEVFSTGKFLREYANELGVSILELNEMAKKDFKYDLEIDNKIVKFAKENVGRNIVFDSRMAWHFVENAFKVHLLVKPEVAAERVFGKRESTEETYKSIEETQNDLKKRREVEAERYKMIYNVSMLDYKNYDLFIDTSNITPEQVCKLIVDGVREFEEKGVYKKMFISPQNIYPTSLDIDEDKVEEIMQRLEKGDKIPPVEIIKVDESLYAYTGHNKLIAYNKLNLPLIEAQLLFQDDDLMSTGEKTSNYITTTMDDIKVWQDICGFKYGYIPQKVKSL